MSGVRRMRRTLHHPPRGVTARDAHDAATRMTPRSAKKQSVHGRAILSGTGNRTDHHELIQPQLRVVPVTAADAEFPLDIRRSQQLRGVNRFPQTGRMALESVDDEVREALLLLL